jgi:hypothetical protein
MRTPLPTKAPSSGDASTRKHSAWGVRRMKQSRSLDSIARAFPGEPSIKKRKSVEDGLNIEDVLMHTIKTNVPGVVLDIAKHARAVDTVEDFKNQFGEMVVNHMVDTVVTSTISHALHNIP